MFVEQLALLEDYLKQHRMGNTLQILRQEMAEKIPNKPSNQLLSLIDTPKVDNIKPQQQKPDPTKKKKP